MFVLVFALLIALITADREIPFCYRQGADDPGVGMLIYESDAARERNVYPYSCPHACPCQCDDPIVEGADYTISQGLRKNTGFFVVHSQAEHPIEFRVEWGDGTEERYIVPPFAGDIGFNHEFSETSHEYEAAVGVGGYCVEPTKESYLFSL